MFNYHTKTGSGKGKGSLGKKRKIPLRVWTREFICLARTGDNRPPSSLEAGQLMMAGLGRKSITFFEDGDAAGVHDEIMAAFPVLRENGYELLRAGPKNSNLQLIPPPPALQKLISNNNPKFWVKIIATQVTHVMSHNNHKVL